jgi:tRNA1(Val) A37 N6-methylase TrmN6
MSLDQPTAFVKHQTLSRDAFLGGRLTLSQPLKGFRAGLDSVLLGASVPKDTARLLDLGAGVGTAGLVAASLDLAAQVTLAERDSEISVLAEANVRDNGFTDRAGVLNVDITSPSSRREMGFPENAFDSVIANPPYFDAGRGTLASGDYRQGARHMTNSELELWGKAAAGAARASGLAIFVYPATGLAALLAAFDQRFGAIEILPLAPRPGQAASRVLIRGRKGSRAPLTLHATRYLHGEQGNAFAQEFSAILMGQGGFDW